MSDTTTLDNRSLVATVWDLLDADDTLDDHVKYLVIAAMESDQALAEHVGGAGAVQVRPADEAADEQPAGAFVREIAVAGFRGIGSRATLQITPYPGITVISGRNGSGKSSFAEAFEFALTGESYRFKHKGQLWQDNWRNLHTPDPCEVQVEFTVEDSRTTTIGAQWAPGIDDLGGAKHWSQRAGERRQQGVAALGWTTALEIYRPILSYEEIGGLLVQEPSKLYDELAKLLALHEITDAEARLHGALTEHSRPRQAAKEALTQLKATLDGSEDERASTLVPLVKKRRPDLDAINSQIAGGGDSEEGTVARLKSIASLPVPGAGEATAIAQSLRDALVNERSLADGATKLAVQRADLIRAAIEYRVAGNEENPSCPVCGEGHLDAQWASDTRKLLDRESQQLAMFHEVRAQVSGHEQDARTLLQSFAGVQPVDGVTLAALDDYRDAVDALSQIPESVADLPSHLEQNLPLARGALIALQSEVNAEITSRGDAWAPIAEEISGWLALERVARKGDDTLGHLKKARDWVRSNTATLRAQRLEPIAEAARQVWAQLRQESNVEIGAITLEGTRTRRKAVLEAAVDGEPAGAVSVMSQGELHALALALFLPRATASASPFRFIVLDDPIQAMDPAKIEGFLGVLQSFAETRQVIVFSHDDRLATAIRQRSLNAQLLEVTRETGSTLTVRSADAPALRYVEDAFALVVDENVPDEVKRRAAPGLFRFAIESAARQVFFTRRNVNGCQQTETEMLWSDARRVTASVALALDTDISGWRARRDYRQRAMQMATKGVHAGATVSKSDISDLRHTVDDILAER